LILILKSFFFSFLAQSWALGLALDLGSWLLALLALGSWLLALGSWLLILADELLNSWLLALELLALESWLLALGSWLLALELLALGS
jgi:hypothetical protein